MFRASVSILLMFGLLGGNIVAVPHSHHLGMVDARMQHHMLPHFHLSWLGAPWWSALPSRDDVTRNGRCTSAATVGCCDADCSAAVHGLNPPHDADAVYLVGARVVANIKGGAPGWGVWTSMAVFPVPQVPAMATELFHLREPKSSCVASDLYLRQNVIRI